MKAGWMGVAVLAVVFLFGGCGSEKKESQPAAMKQPAQEKQASVTVAQTICPVMGGEINKDVYVDYEGQRVYFCCPGCEEKFLEDPEKYLKKMAAEGVVPEDVPGGHDHAHDGQSHESHSHD